MELVIPLRIVLVGEAMIELSRRAESWQLGHGGDTLNTALHLARGRHDVAYLTGLGSDPFAASLVDRWQGEGLDCSLVLHHPARTTGLYAISTDAVGERSFAYWRECSAARELCTLPGAPAAAESAAQADLLVFSLISLAILPPEGREWLFAIARRVRAKGGQVAFDGNYRPRLWSDADTARQTRDTAIGLASIGLPTLEDEAALSGEIDAAAVAQHWRSLGCEETVVKLGAAGCQLPDGEIVAPPEALLPVDTSGAGDAFNAGYLGARLRGESMQVAARAGHALAGWTIMRPGAIPDRDS